MNTDLNLTEFNLHPEHRCPVCKYPMHSVPDATGIMVWCGCPPDICPCAEVQGHGASVKAAAEVVRQKFSRQHEN